MPVSKLTADTANKVIGEWYFSADQWFKSSQAQIYAGQMDKTALTKLQTTVCLLPGGRYPTLYVYKDPERILSPGSSQDSAFDPEGSATSYGTKPKVVKVYYEYMSKYYGEFYFDGSHWIPKLYTSNYTKEHNKNYAIVRDTNYYSVPIADDVYKVGVYLYGERVSVPYIAVNQPNWAYTGRGWIELEGNTSEVL
jgi:hypothetical protein